MARMGRESRHLLRGWICAIFFLIFCGAAAAQYTDKQAIDDLGGPQSFAARRADLAKQLKTGYAILFARNEIPESTHYREDNDFYYFTGLQDPGAVMLMDVEKGTTVIFEPAQAGRTAQVYGPNLLSLPPADREALGYKVVLPVSDLDTVLSYALARGGTPDLWLRLGFPDKADGARPEVGRDHAWKFAHPYHEPIPSDLAPAKLLAERYAMAHLRDMTPVIDEMRNIKRPEEIEVLRRIGKISAEGNRDAMAHAHPGMYQYQIEARAYFYDFDHGAQGASYLAIVGSGNDINTWHYFSNRHKIEANQLVVFDFAAFTRSRNDGHHAHVQHQRQIHSRTSEVVRGGSRMPESDHRACSRPATRTKKPTPPGKPCSTKPASAISGTDIRDTSWDSRRMT